MLVSRSVGQAPFRQPRGEMTFSIFIYINSNTYLSPRPMDLFAELIYFQDCSARQTCPVRASCLSRRAAFGVPLYGGAAGVKVVRAAAQRGCQAPPP